MIMNRRIALDTNILVYFHSNDEPDKQKKAIDLFALYPVISTQVLSEYFSVVKSQTETTQRWNNGRMYAKYWNVYSATG